MKTKCLFLAQTYINIKHGKGYNAVHKTNRTLTHYLESAKFSTKYTSFILYCY